MEKGWQLVCKGGQGDTEAHTQEEAADTGGGLEARLG